MTQEVAQRSPAQQLVANIRSEDFKQQVGLALPEGMPASRFVRAAVTALLENPEITEAEPNSLYQAVLRSAQDGLLPDGREAALVLYKKKGEQRKRAQYLPMIGGYRKVAAEHGWALRTEVVREGDTFDYELGLEPRLTHRRAPLGDKPGDLVGAYAVGKHLATGATELEVMTGAEIAKVRATSRAKDAGPWVDWPERMWEKTVGRRLFKKLPLGDRERVHRMLDADELSPVEAEALVYGDLPAIEAGSSGSAASSAAAPPGEVAPTSQPAAASPPAFQGAEPAPAPAPEPEPEASDAAAYELSEAFSRYAGKTLGHVAEQGDREYLEWLASDAIDDNDLRAAAAAVLGTLQE